MTTLLILLAALGVCLIGAGLYIRWDYLQDRKDVWDWDEPEQGRSPSARLEAALADADDALHWQAPGTSRRIRGATRVLVDGAGQAIARLTEPDELHWRAA